MHKSRVLTLLEAGVRYAILIVLSSAAWVCNAAFAMLRAVDDRGAEITLTAPAQRVVSLAPHITELIYAAGGGAALAGAVAHRDSPAAAQRVPQVGDAYALDLERIVALKPDLIVAWSSGTPRRQLDALRMLSIPVFCSDPRTLDDIASNLERLGTLLGTAPKAAAAAAKFRADLQALCARYAHRPQMRVFYQISTQPFMTLNAAHPVSEAIALCGGQNIFAHLAALAPQVSLEAVVAADPQVILMARSGATPLKTAQAHLAYWRRWPDLSAVAHHALFVLDADLLDRPGPRIAQGAAQLCSALDAARQRRIAQ